MNLWQEALRWRIPDYLMIVIMVVVAAVIGAKVRPHCRPFRWTDATIGYPFRKNTFPMYAVAIAVVLVALVYIAGELVTRWRRPLTRAYRSRYKVGWVRSMLLHLNGWILVQAYSILLAFAIVNIAKVYAGRLRPDFLARLATEGFANDGSFDSMDASGPICNAAREGRLSFPSGHSGTAFSGFVPPCMYLMGLTRQLHRGNSYFVITLCLLPLILPIAVGVSRTLDFRHNFDDVLCGAVIGSACGVFAVLFSFAASDTGEWTLRSHPVHERDCGDDEEECPAEGEGGESRGSPNRVRGHGDDAGSSRSHGANPMEQKASGRTVHDNECHQPAANVLSGAPSSRQRSLSDMNEDVAVGIEMQRLPAAPPPQSRTAWT